MARTYRLDWVTAHIAVGGAPVSYDQLDAIKRQGVAAIVNLCAEYCDLHGVESSHGFEVFYLPIADEDIPDPQALEEAMAWMDRLIGQDKRILIHCRLGIGRTGTLLYAYLNSRNLFARIEKETLAQLRSRPATSSQWRLANGYAAKTATSGPAQSFIMHLRQLLQTVAAWLSGRGRRDKNQAG